MLKSVQRRVVSGALRLLYQTCVWFGTRHEGDVSSRLRRWIHLYGIGDRVKETREASPRHTPRVHAAQPPRRIFIECKGEMR